MMSDARDYFSDPRIEEWLSRLEERHLATLTFSELARALRALSSCYVERRSKLAAGGALASNGKRAAFAMFYGPIHLLMTRHVVRSLGLDRERPAQIHDLGCGTGVAGAAWSLESGARVSGLDRHPWAVAEANWTYQALRIDGRAAQGDLARWQTPAAKRTGILAAYAINELPQPVRDDQLRRLLAAAAAGAHVLVLEPIARRLAPWWSAWETAFEGAGGRSDEWRLTAALPARQRALGKAAGLSVREMTARSLFLPPRASAQQDEAPK